MYKQKMIALTLPYKGERGVELVKNLKRITNKFLPSNTKAVFTGRKRGVWSAECGVTLENHGVVDSAFSTNVENAES